MSKTISESIYVWSYPRCKVHTGYHISAKIAGCERLLNELKLYNSEQLGELIVRLLPVTTQSLRVVNSRDNGPISFQTLRIAHAKELSFEETGNSLRLGLTPDDFDLLCELSGME